MDAIRALAATLAFGLELCLLGAVAYWGYQASADSTARIGLAVGSALAVAVLWGFLLAPRSARRLPLWPRLAVEAALFGLGAVALAAAGQVALGVLFAIAAIVRFALGLATGLDAEGI